MSAEQRMLSAAFLWAQRFRVFSMSARSLELTYGTCARGINISMEGNSDPWEQYINITLDAYYCVSCATAHWGCVPACTCTDQIDTTLMFGPLASGCF